MQKMMRLVVLEEFNLNLNIMRECVEDMITKKVFDDEGETPAVTTHIEMKERNRLETAVLGEYPV